MPEAQKPFLQTAAGRLAALAAFLLTAAGLWNWVFGETPRFPLTGSTAVRFHDSGEWTEDDDVELDRFGTFLVHYETSYVRLDVSLENSPYFENAADPLHDRALFSGAHVTYYLGPTREVPEDIHCTGGPCPDEPYLVHIGRGVYTVVFGDRFLDGGIAIGIEKTKHYLDNIDRTTRNHRLRGCFLSVGKIGPEGHLLFVPILLRPAPGQCGE